MSQGVLAIVRSSSEFNDSPGVGKPSCEMPGCLNAGIFTACEWDVERQTRRVIVTRKRLCIEHAVLTALMESLPMPS